MLPIKVYWAKNQEYKIRVKCEPKRDSWWQAVSVLSDTTCKMVFSAVSLGFMEQPKIAI